MTIWQDGNPVNKIECVELKELLVSKTYWPRKHVEDGYREYEGA